MLTHHTAIVKDKNRVIGTSKVVELDSGSQRREHGKSAFYDVNVSQCPNTHQCHKSKLVDLFQLILVKHDATRILRRVSGMKMGNTKWKTHLYLANFRILTKNDLHYCNKMVVPRHPGSFFDVHTTFLKRNKCSIAFLDKLCSWKNSVGVDWMNLKNSKKLLFFVRILSAPNHMKRFLRSPKHADTPCSYS